MIYLAVLAGALANLLLSWNEALPKPDYKFKIFVKQNFLPLVLNIILGMLLAIFSKDVSNLDALFFGFGGQYLFKKLANIMTERVPTKIGLNE
jgi:hypothetical protein